MKRLIFWLIVLAIVTGSGAAGYKHFYTSTPGAGDFRTAAVRRTDVKLVVNSSGTVQPVLSVQVGSFVSGPIQKVHVDFNAVVKKDQLLAEVDPLIYKAQLAQAKATLLHAVADLEQYKAKLVQTEGDWKRAKRLRPDRCSEAKKTGIEFHALSDSDYDMADANCQSAHACVEVAKAAIEQNKAALDMAETNLAYTFIRSPVDGVVIDRKVDPGQTVASQFQTPVLFVVAPDLQKKVYVYASVDEADIGLIRDAQARKEPVSFAVDAYPKDTFAGKIAQVRLNPTTVQNVVTYTVVVEAANAQLKLLPGMTANLAFHIEGRSGVLALPNAALRFHPKPEQVRVGDRPILEGEARGQKHVWILDGDLLAAVEVVTGLSDKSSTEIISGDLAEGQEVVIGTLSAASKGAGSPPPPPP
jgi:HlyD family secretion protein